MGQPKQQGLAPWWQGLRNLTEVMLAVALGPWQAWQSQAGGHALPALPTVHFGLCAQLLPVRSPEEVAALLEHQEHHPEGL